MAVHESAFLDIEASLADRLFLRWRQQTKDLIEAIWVALEGGRKAEAVELANSINLSKLVNGKDAQYLDYLSNAALLFGATRVTPDPRMTAIPKGNFDDVLAHSQTLLERSIRQNVEDYLRFTLLELIAEYDLNDPATNFTSPDNNLSHYFRVRKIHHHLHNHPHSCVDYLQSVVKYSPDQPRDDQGRWTDGTGQGSTRDAPTGGPSADARGDSGRGHSPSAERASGTGAYRRGNPAVLLRVAGNVPATRWSVDRYHKQLFADRNVPHPDYLELQGPVAAKAFREQILLAKEKNPSGASVHAYDEADYAKMKLFTTDDGQAGFAVKEDGDIVSVFNSGTLKGVTFSALSVAVENGGRKLDAFDPILPRIYAKANFTPTSRLKWDDEQAPANWNKAKFGTPDVVFMVYDPKRNYREYEKGEGPTVSSYDDAVKLQTERVVKYDPDQARAPAGSSEGGQWVKGATHFSLGKEARETDEYKRMEVKLDAANKAADEKRAAVIAAQTEELRAKLQGVEGEFAKDLLKDPKALESMAMHMALSKTGAFEPELSASLQVRADMENYVFKYISDRLPPPSPYAEEARQDNPQTQLPAFKSWFGDSKVVDADGKPLVVFHGSDEDFEAFDTAINGDKPDIGNWCGSVGTWFASPSRDKGNYDPGNAESVANDFSGASGLMSEGPAREGAVVYPVYLSIKKPMEYEGYDDFQDAIGKGSSSDLRKRLVKKGYDGIVIRNSMTDGDADRDDWVAFNPEQIKSALGNVGAFDPKSKSIIKFDPDQPRDEQGRWTDTGAVPSAPMATAVGMGARVKVGPDISPVSEEHIQREVARHNLPAGTVSVVTTQYPFKLGGVDYLAAGTADPETKKIDLYLGQLTNAGLTGVIAHEAQHVKFHYALDAYAEESKRLLADKRDIMRADGTIRDGTRPADKGHSYVDEYPIYVSMRDSLEGDWKEMQKSDGVSEYSTAYWKEAPHTQNGLMLAVNETLAEVARIKEEQRKLPAGPRGYKKMNPVWEKLYATVNGIYTKLKDAGLLSQYQKKTAEERGDSIIIWLDREWHVVYEADAAFGKIVYADGSNTFCVPATAKKYDPDQPRDPAGTTTGGQWARTAGGPAGDVRNFVHSLGIKRKDMPQIRSKDMPEFMTWAAEEKGVAVTETTELVGNLRPTQTEYNQRQAMQMTGEAKALPITISKDNYVLDGTNRYVALLQDDPAQEIKVRRVDLPVREALQLMLSFPKAFSKDVAQVGSTEALKKSEWSPAQPNRLYEWLKERGKLVEKYDEDQPRDPKGTPTGGQWSPAKGSVGMEYDPAQKAWVHPERAVSAADQARLKELKVPPNWKNVHLNPDPQGALQAKGQDAAGRWQPKYSAAHHERAGAEKFARGRDFNKVMPQVQAAILRDIENPPEGVHPDTVAALRLIEQTGFRPGSSADDPLVKHKAYGGVTLLGHHLTKMEGDKMSFSFIGKKGVRINKTISDPVLAKYITDKGGPRKGVPLFGGTSEDDVGQYLKSIAGDQFKTKDIRTWHGTAKAIETIRKLKHPKTEDEFRKFRQEVGKAVSKHLGNTPAVALKSYIDPAVFSGWSEQWPAGMLPKPKKPKVASEMEDFQELLDEYYATDRYDRTPQDWREVPETGHDPDDELVEDPHDTVLVRKFAKPFVSFRDAADDSAQQMLQLVSTLHTSRLSAWGFTIEAEVTGVSTYAISAQLDDRVCPVCEEMHGREFKVEDASDALNDILKVEDPDDLKTLQPWPKQDKQNVEEMRQMTNEELVDRNWHIPPYHPNCRCLLVKVEDVHDISATPSWRAAHEVDIDSVFTNQAVLDEYLSLDEAIQIRSILGGATTPAEVITEWNRLKGIYPTEALELLMGVSDSEVLAGEVLFPDIPATV